VRLELAWLDHHVEVWSEHHAAPREPRGAGRACNRHSGHISRQHKRVELPLEVTVLDVVTPLALPLDGNAAILTIMMVVELGPEVGCRDARYRHTRRGRHMRS
jgi:hypothetical protein